MTQFKRKAASGGDKEQEEVATEAAHGVSYVHLAHVLNGVKQQQSMSGIAKNIACARMVGAAFAPGHDSRDSLTQIAGSIAKHVRYETKSLLENATMKSLSQDAMDNVMAIRAKAIAWRLPPRRKEVRLPIGCVPLCPDGQGPWHIHRFVGVAELGGDETTAAMAVTARTMAAAMTAAETTAGS